MKEITHYLNFTSIVTYQIPIYADGLPGNPEIKSKFTTEPTTANKSKKKPVVKQVKLDATVEDDDEVIEL
jgi:hypothetical protein